MLKAWWSALALLFLFPCGQAIAGEPVDCGGVFNEGGSPAFTPITQWAPNTSYSTMYGPDNLWVNCIAPEKVYWALAKIRDDLPATNYSFSERYPVGEHRDTMAEAIDDARLWLIDRYGSNLDHTGNGCSNCSVLTNAISNSLQSNSNNGCYIAGNSQTDYVDFTPCQGTLYSNGSSWAGTAPTGDLNTPVMVRVSIYNAIPSSAYSNAMGAYLDVYHTTPVHDVYGTWPLENEVVNRPVCPEGYLEAFGSDINGDPVLACALTLAQARADGMSGLDSTLEGCGTGCNPVNLATGVKLDHVEDYRNSSPFPIVWDRYYHSSKGSWTFGYERSLRKWEDSANHVKRIAMQRPDGTVLSFKHTGTLSDPWDLDMPSNNTVLGVLRNAITSGVVVGYDYKNLQDETEHYDMDGKLQSIESRQGWLLSFDYDTHGDLSRVEDSFGRYLDITRSSPNTFGVSWVESVGDGMTTVSYTQSMAQGPEARGGRVLLDHVEYPDSTETTYLYDEDLVAGRGLLTGIMDTATHRWATYTYDEQGRVTSSRHDPNIFGARDAINYTYDNDLPGQWDKPTQVSWEGGTTAVGSRLANSTGIPKVSGYSQPCPVCSGSKLADIQYDAKGNPTSFQDFEGVLTTRTYDTDRGLMTEQTQADGTAQERTTQITWHSDFRLPEVVVEPIEVAGVTHTRTTTWTYNTRGLPTSKVVSVSTGEPSRTWSWTYYANGLLETATTPGSRTTTYEWDGGGHGNLVSITNPQGHETTYGNYTPTGKPGLITDPNGLQTKLTYDSRDRLTKIERGSASTHWETTQVSYTHWGAVSRIDLPSGDWTEFLYNGARQPWRQVKSDGYLELYPDQYGRSIQDYVYDVNDTPKRWMDRTFDARGNLESQWDAYLVGKVYAYDDEGRLTSSTDGLSYTQQWQYDALGRLTAWLDEASKSHTLVYDPQDQLLEATSADGTTTLMGYNGFGERVLLDSPNSGQSTFTYNANGELVSATDARGVAQAITRDSLGRPTSIVFDDSGVVGSPAGLETGIQTQTLGYDTCINGIGRLCSMTDPSGATAFEYDLWGRLAKQEFTPAGKTFTLEVAYAYDSHGRRVATTYPTGRTLVASYTQERVDSLAYDGTVVLDQVSYEPFTREVRGWEWGGGLGTVTYFRDYHPQINWMVADKTYAYDYDDRKQIESINGFSDYNDSAWWTHDSRGRLTQANLANRPDPVDYTYDDGGNLTSKTQGSVGSTMSYTSGTQRLNSITPPSSIPQTWTYDAAGNLIDDGAGQSFTYDAQNRMARATDGGFITTFAYNAQGQRVLKQRVAGGSGSDYFVYDDLGRLLGVYDGTGAVREELVWFDGWRPVMTARGTGSIYDVYRIVSDRQQIPVGVLDATGTRVWEWDGREPYGYQLPNQDKDGDSVNFVLNLRMPGQWFDSETGLYHNGFRDYDPQVGRYIQPDPIGLAGGWNEYAYVGSDPVEGVDPYGLEKMLWLEGTNQPGIVSVLPSYPTQTSVGGHIEPVGHMSISYGDPNGRYKSVSYGLNGFLGHAYQDIYPGGTIIEAYLIDDKTETMIDDEMRVLVDHFERNYLIPDGYTCRTFSRDYLRHFIDKYNLKKTDDHPARASSR